MRLSNLIESIEVVHIYREQDVEISGISYHSQMVQKGHLFVCVRGVKTDGHKYLKQATENGAVAAIVEEVNEKLDIPQIVVKNARTTLATVGAIYYNHPSKKLKMIGITATNGKTTTSYITNAILENYGLQTGLIGTVQIKMGDTSIPSKLTTPESLDLQYYLNEMVKKDITHVTMEVSSAAQFMNRVDHVDYDIVAFNNFSSEHMEMHGTMENYFEAKSRLIRHASKDSFAILNLDNAKVASLVDQTKAKVVTYSVEGKKGDLYCKNLDLSTGRAKFTIEVVNPIKVTDDYTIEKGEFDIELAVPGLHSVYNSMAAIIIGLINGVSISSIQETLKYFSGVERRFEYIYEEDIKIIDDHFANPGNIDVTLNTLKFMDYENLHLVYAIRGSRGYEVNRDNALAIAKWAPKLGIREIIATKSISDVTEKDVVTEEEVEVFLKVMKEANIHVRLYEELPEAIHDVLTSARFGDLVLLAGCQGMDNGAKIALSELEKSEHDYSQQTI